MLRLRGCSRLVSPLTRGATRALASKPKHKRDNAKTSSNERASKVRDSASVQATAEKQLRHQAAMAQAKWVTSWMMPWERAQMDSPTRPLSVWERAYWRLFIALGGVGLIYETWVMGNRRLWVSDQGSELESATKELYNDGAFRSTRLLSDDEIESVVSRSRFTSD
ncbi:unnamed protein product [Agarophyton chilense]